MIMLPKIELPAHYNHHYVFINLCLLRSQIVCLRDELSYFKFLTGITKSLNRVYYVYLTKSSHVYYVYLTKSSHVCYVCLTKSIQPCLLCIFD